MFEDCPWAFENYDFALQFSNHVLRHSWYATGRQQISFDLHQKLVAVWRVFCLLMTFPAYKKVFTEATKRFINTKKGIYALFPRLSLKFGLSFSLHSSKWPARHEALQARNKVFLRKLP